MRRLTKLFCTVFLLLAGSVGATAQEDEVFDFDASFYHSWSEVSATAIDDGEAGGGVVIGEEVAEGGVIWGDLSGGVPYLKYANITDYSELRFEGTPGAVLRLICNRTVNEGPYFEFLPTIGEDGKLTVSISDLKFLNGGTPCDFVCLQSIKLPWGGTACTITSIKIVKPVNPLSIPMQELEKAINLAKLQPSFAKTEESWYILQQTIVAGEAALTASDATANSLQTATTAIYDAITGLTLQKGYSNLTSDMFLQYMSVMEPGEGTVCNSAYNLFTVSDVPYGDSNVSELKWADLSAYDMLVVTTTDNIKPRFCLNRLEADGLQAETQEESKMIDINPNNSFFWSTEKYQTISGDSNVYTIDLATIVAEYGFARLHCIKKQGWGEGVVVTGMYLYKDEKVTWTVAGSKEALNGDAASWSPSETANDMTTVDGVNYSLVVTGCTLEANVSYQYKVVKNHAWGEEYPSSNRVFTVPETAVYTVEYYFNAETKEVSETTTKTGEAGDISHVYSIVGDLTGSWETDWDFTPTDAPNVYTCLVKGFESSGSEYAYKVRSDHDWSGYQLPTDDSNYLVYIEAGVWDLSFTLDIEKNELNLIVTENEDRYLIDMQEWQVLAAWYASVGQGAGWSKPWDFSVATPSTKTLPGVTATDGHVVGIDLSNNQLSGAFPYALLALPMLESLNLSGNQLSGDIGVMTYAFAQQNPTMMTHLQELNISGNQFSGNIGLFANCFANLQALNASNNCLEDVYPMIPTTVTTLDLSRQTISRVVPLHLANLSVADIATKVPSILLYDHANQTFTPNINLMCTTADNSWGMMLAYQNGQLAIPYVSEQNTYYGETGDTLNVYVYNNYATPEGSTFRIALSFDEGDGNFDGKVNVLDLQTNILYIMEKYLTRPYNFTAANLWKDDLINVQDVICLVNQLMAAEQEQAQAAPARRYAPGSVGSCDASVYLQDGKLMLNSIRPVAAFDVLLNGANSLSVANDLERMGMTFVMRRQADGIRVIAYSMNGACIPSGTTAIGTVDSNAAAVSHVMLSDGEANAITVSFGGTATGIESIVSSSANDGQAIYDLQGRKVNAASHKGLYIKNGHKMIK